MRGFLLPLLEAVVVVLVLLLIFLVPPFFLVFEIVTPLRLQHQSKQNKIEQNQKESAKAFAYGRTKGEVRVEREASNKE